MQADQPIHEAAFNGDLAEVQRLITDDPSLVDLQGRYDDTPLIVAAQEGHTAIVEWLIDHGGANIDAQNSLGFTGLYRSSRNDHLEVVSILLNRGADIKMGSPLHCRPLMIAAARGHIGVVEIFLSEEGIDLDGQGGYGWYLLWMATIVNKQEEVLKLLLAAGADPRIARNGVTPLDKARDYGHEGCIRLLEAALAEPERARMLHRARAINDAHHAINKVARETEGMVEEDRKRKMIAAAPVYLKRRVGEGIELPQVESMQASRHATEEEEKLAAVDEQMVIDGQVPGEVFVELMEMMVMKWDDERRRL